MKKDEQSSIVDFKSLLRKVEIDKKDEGGDEYPHVDDDDKRRSTGSINSLKKLWENKDGEPQQISPKLGHKGVKSEDCDSSPPEKPTVPAKPAVKPAKPAVPPPAKPALPSNIYATPGQMESKTKEQSKDKESVLEISQSLEMSLSALKTGTTPTTATWLQLSDKVLFIFFPTTIIEFNCFS